MLEDIEMFGLPGVEHAGDLSPIQTMFLEYARAERADRMSPD